MTQYFSDSRLSQDKDFDVDVRCIIMFQGSVNDVPYIRSRKGRSDSPQSRRPSAAGQTGSPRTRCFCLQPAQANIRVSNPHWFNTDLNPESGS
jgi:hypothetical protein